MSPGSKVTSQTCIWLVLISILVIRLLFLGAYPLADTTEARYGEMGRLILDTGDWITPQISNGVPFWGKPPLSFWLTAVSYKLLGVNEFSARLPSFLLSVLVIVLVWKTAIFQADRSTALMACAVMASSVVFWVSSGAVMTDLCLMAGTTISMMVFWRCVKSPCRKEYGWGILFFVGLAIGLMAKGPIAAILVFLPVLTWSLVQKDRSVILKKLPWATGGMVTLLLTLPWYWMAEMKTPGFLEYFFVGEHIKRFLVPGWTGDLYGSGHSQPKGMIWLFWLIGDFPWSFILAFQIKNKTIRQKITAKIKEKDGWYLYLVLWAAAPMIFFTLAGNILWVYVLPGIPAFSLLAAEILRLHGNEKHHKVIKKASGVMAAVFLMVSFVVLLGVGPAQKSQKQMIEIFNRLNNGSEGKLSYLFKRPFSAEFYSRGSAAEIISASQLNALFANTHKDYLVIKKRYLQQIPEQMIGRFEKIEKINGYYIFVEKHYNKHSPNLRPGLLSCIRM